MQDVLMKKLMLEGLNIPPIFSDTWSHFSAPHIVHIMLRQLIKSCHHNHLTCVISFMSGFVRQQLFGRAESGLSVYSNCLHSILSVIQENVSSSVSLSLTHIDPSEDSENRKTPTHTVSFGITVSSLSLSDWCHMLDYEFLMICIDDIS